MRAGAAMAIAAVLLVTGCGGDDTVSGPSPQAPRKIELLARGFGEGERILKQYTCDGRNVSPRLAWSGVPRGTKEIALLVEDQDAPGGTFVHWVLFGLEPRTHVLDEGRVPAGTRQGKNGFGDAEYGGPCPPEGDEPHRYVFSIYALRAPIDAGDGADAQDVRNQIRGRATATGRLTGLYGR
jgi:Raf kinase inhibitor-like YbhB/YbcL family protein